MVKNAKNRLEYQEIHDSPVFRKFTTNLSNRFGIFKVLPDCQSAVVLALELGNFSKTT